MRLLVTGSNGFIGGRIVAQARERGWTVAGLGRQPDAAHPVDHYARVDLTDADALDVSLASVLTAFRGPPDAVIHAAALASPWAHPAAFEAANVGATRHVADWASRHDVPHLVYVSSSSVLYRRADQLGLTEASPIPADAAQINVYSRTKRVGERLVEGYAGMSTIIRPRAVFGPGDTVLLPRLVAAARKGQLPLFTRPDGDDVQCDLTDVNTTAHAILTAVERSVTGPINVTNGEPVQLYPFLLGVLDRLGVPVPRRRVPVRVAMAGAGLAEVVSARFLGYREPPITRFGVAMFAWSKTFDIARQRDTLGPPLVPLDEAVERLVAWWRDSARE